MITVEGDAILVNGVGLTDEELALLEPVALAALILAADMATTTTAEILDACVDVVVGQGFVTVNADLTLCGVPVTLNPDGSATMADVAIPAVLLDADALTVLGLVANVPDPADIDRACHRVTVTDGELDLAAVRPETDITLCAAMSASDGNATINGTFVDADELVDASGETDYRRETVTGVNVRSGVELEIDLELVIGIRVFGFDLDGCGSGVIDRFGLVITVHNCPNVSTQSEFEAIEARAATNPTTPNADHGPIAELLLECPTVVLEGDNIAIGVIGGGTSTFDFRVWGDAGESYRLSTQAQFSVDNLCEAPIAYDIDRDGTLEADVCHDLSGYILRPTDGTVTIIETVVPAGFSFGTVRLRSATGLETIPEELTTLVSATNGEIVLDGRTDDDGGAYLDVYNFVSTGTAGEIPDTAMTPP